MVEPWETVDLTMTCDSDAETSMMTMIPRPPVDEQHRRSSGKILPTLAQRFTEIYSRQCSSSLEKSFSLEGSPSRCHNIGAQRSESPGDTKHNLKVYSTFSITSISFNNDLSDAEMISPAFKLDSSEETGSLCEVIEIDDDSNDQTADDAPASTAGAVVPSGNDCHGSMKIEDFVLTESDHTEEVDVKYHNVEPPDPHSSSSVPLSTPEPHITSNIPCVELPDNSSCHYAIKVEDSALTENDHWEEVDVKYHPPEFLTKSPDPHLSFPVPLSLSPESHIISDLRSPEPSLVDQQADPLLDDINGITMPQCKSPDVDKRVKYETESTVSINSENESDNSLVQSPPSPMYYCSYCDYSTTVEECCRQHITSHLPGPKPYLRMYCTECSLSTNSEKFLLRHLQKTHHIMNPDLYRSGEDRYTCSFCKITQKSRADVEFHIYNRHKSRNQVVVSKDCTKGDRIKGIRYQCVEKGCAQNYKDFSFLRNHIIKKHGITPLSYYEYVPIRGKPSKHAIYRCFGCCFKGSNKKQVRLHAKMHYNSKKGKSVDEIHREIHDEEFKIASSHVSSSEPHVKSQDNHEKSPKPRGNTSDTESSEVLAVASPEADLVNSVHQAADPASGFVDEERIEMPEHSESFQPQFDRCSGDEEVDDSSDSDFKPGNRQDQPRTFYCIYCEYSTVIEEWYHKHIASHLPGTKPYFRMYCTECLYSTGSETYLLFHMSQTHRITNPEFYRSGEKRYTCRTCRHTVELRIDIESHIKAKHKSEKQTRAKTERSSKVKFQCSEKKCSKRYKNLKSLHSHVQKHHNVRFPLYYYERSEATGELKFTCFSCYEIIEKKRGRCHSRVHFSRKQRRTPYLYYCPEQDKNVKCQFSCKKRSEITEHYQTVHCKDLKYYKKSKCTYACLNCPSITSSLSLMKNHCTVHCKNRGA